VVWKQQQCGCCGRNIVQQSTETVGTVSMLLGAAVSDSYQPDCSRLLWGGTCRGRWF